MCFKGFRDIVYTRYTAKDQWNAELFWSAFNNDGLSPKSHLDPRSKQNFSNLSFSNTSKASVFCFHWRFVQVIEYEKPFIYFDRVNRSHNTLRPKFWTIWSITPLLFRKALFMQILSAPLSIAKHTSSKQVIPYN